VEIWPFEIRYVMRGEFVTPFFGRGDYRGPSIVPLERVMVVSLLSIVTIAVSVTILAAICRQVGKICIVNVLTDA